MTDDPGVKAMLKFNLARDTFHQQQWLRGIEELVADGLTDVIEDSNAENEDADQARTYWSLHEGSTGPQGSWAQGRTLVTDQEVLVHQDAPESTDDGTLPPPDPNLYATYDGSLGPGQPGDPTAAQSMLSKIKKAID
jgi:Mn-containing catalase